MISTMSTAFVVLAVIDFLLFVAYMIIRARYKKAEPDEALIVFAAGRHV